MSLVFRVMSLVAVTPWKASQYNVCRCRESLYLAGGVLFVTSRILVVDMLTKKLPIHLVTGIVVYRAHKYVMVSLAQLINCC